MHAVKRRNRTHEIHNLHKTHRPRSLQNALSVAPAQAEPGLKHSFSCLSILAKANMLKQLKLWLEAGLLPAQGAEGHLQVWKPSEKKSFRRPTCHAYDYAALIVPTAVCICIGMHAVKRRNRTHEIHNLHKTHRPRSLQNALSVAPAQAGPGLKHSFSCLSILAKANMLKQLKLCLGQAPACAEAG